MERLDVISRWIGLEGLLCGSSPLFSLHLKFSRYCEQFGARRVLITLSSVTADLMYGLDWIMVDLVVFSTG